MNKYKCDFPLFDSKPDVAYLDSAASSLKARRVIEKLNHYYNDLGVNVHRGVYELSYEATNLYEEARMNIAKFINAKFEEIIFTRGTTASLNLVAMSYGLDFLKPGDEIVLSVLEHHSNFIPWQIVAKKTGAILRFIELDSDNRITYENAKKVINEKTKIVAINHVSNVMGFISPVKEITKLAHSFGAIVVCDGAQAVPHMKVDVKDLDVDFYAFSGHKMTGPTGIGVLYGKKVLLDKMEPLEYGGDMADEVFKDKSTYKDTPYKFEAGTPIIAEAIGLGEACLYLNEVGFDYIQKQEYELKEYAVKELKKIQGLTIYNESAETGIVTLNIEGVHPHDVASVLDQNNVCIRAGHHCAMPITRHLGVLATIRVSIYFYNDKEDIDKLVQALKMAADFFLNF